ncbi:class I SAM-dependent methyltransferase [Alkalihalobacterium chitinilyticum]|uniref:Class I SAM-dependent methyltransferase n=1 Tax=Alkalihalobacterium chitinilyticum TaxID=2980103 RepID=A0ABT5VBN6_9BACI|nr:class I SAM-dependent methyltransferase [Alkalihalobacterium chitinilyticum]MDE5412879.1 class I SAM-dependent methyltransferase [Alkalihalobacterium chitinilyticum]
MYITTALKHNEKLVEEAKTISLDLDALYIDREDKPIEVMIEELGDDIFVVGKKKLFYYSIHSTEPFFFHPNSAMFRFKRLQKDGYDPFIEVSQLQEGMSLLDCTLGLGSDAIIAQSVVGSSGKVAGIEGSRSIAYIVKEGLKHWDSGNNLFNQAMRSVQVIHGNHFEVLRRLEDASYDVVYFDPMFEADLETSQGLTPLKSLALYQPITVETIKEAKRVARQRVVFKDHWKSDRFAKFGFDVIKRRTSKFHFGYYDINSQMNK